MLILGLFVIVVGLAVWYLYRKARLESLTKRFGPEAAARIMRGEVWQGQPFEALTEALGPPVHTDERVTKAAQRLTLKYKPIGRGRYALRVMVENGVVTGWDQKEEPPPAEPKEPRSRGTQDPLSFLDDAPKAKRRRRAKEDSTDW